MKTLKKILAFAIAAAMIAFCFTGCGNSSTTGESGDTSATSAEASGSKKIALVVNQKFGDQGPSDAMLEGLEKACKEFSYEYITYESSAETFEDDLKSYAENGYDLIISTFPAMQEATSAVAKEYPDTSFFACYQNIADLENVYSTTYRGEKAFYYMGVLAAMMSKSGKIGFVGGCEEPSPNAEANAFMEGVKATSDSAEVQFVYVGSFEDTAGAKAAAETMISDGCDVVQTDSGTCRLGVYEACKEKGALACGDTSAIQADSYPNTVYSVCLVDFAADIYNGVKAFHDGSLELGKNVNVGYDTGVYAIDYDTLDKFKSANDSYASVIDKFTDFVKNNDVDVDYNTDTPDWNKISSK